MSTRGWNTIAAVSVVTVIGIVTAVALSAKPSLNPGIDEGRAVADDFLGRLREDNPSRAWESTTAEFKSAEGRARFVARVKDNPWLLGTMDFNSAQQVKVNDADRLEFVFTSRKTGKLARFLLAKDQGLWRVDRFTF